MCWQLQGTCIGSVLWLVKITTGWEEILNEGACVENLEQVLRELQSVTNLCLHFIVVHAEWQFNDPSLLLQNTVVFIAEKVAVVMLVENGHQIVTHIPKIRKHSCKAVQQTKHVHFNALHFLFRCVEMLLQNVIAETFLFLQNLHTWGFFAMIWKWKRKPRLVSVAWALTRNHRCWQCSMHAHRIICETKQPNCHHGSSFSASWIFKNCIEKFSQKWASVNFFVVKWNRTQQSEKIVCEHCTAVVTQKIPQLFPVFTNDGFFSVVLLLNLFQVVEMRRKNHVKFLESSFSFFLFFPFFLSFSLWGQFLLFWVHHLILIAATQFANDNIQQIKAINSSVLFMQMFLNGCVRMFVTAAGLTAFLIIELHLRHHRFWKGNKENTTNTIAQKHRMFNNNGNAFHVRDDLHCRCCICFHRDSWKDPWIGSPLSFILDWMRLTKLVCAMQHICRNCMVSQKSSSRNFLSVHLQCFEKHPVFSHFCSTHHFGKDEIWAMFLMLFWFSCARVYLCNLWDLWFGEQNPLNDFALAWSQVKNSCFWIFCCWNFHGIW